jgi:hypothetical protein
MLYKYCTFGRGMGILQTQRIRLTQPSDFNDPFEMHPEFQLMSQEDIAELPPALDDQGNAIPGSHVLTPEVLFKLLSFVQPQIERFQSLNQNEPGAIFAIDNNTVGRDFYSQNFGVLSLTETPDNLLMWSHYGSSHKGIVLGFDETHAFFKGAELVPSLERLTRVEYNQKRPVISPTTLNNPKIFLRKSVEWAYEREWRLIRPLSEAAETRVRDSEVPICLFEVPHDAIRMVITGSQMTQSEYQKICTYCSETATLSHVKLHHALLSKELYELEIHPALTEQEQERRLRGKIASAKPFQI